jgi:hypothetical protein
MQIRITRDVRLEHAGREFKHFAGQVLDSSDHPLAPIFSELLNAGAAEPINQEIKTATVEPTERAVRKAKK